MPSSQTAAGISPEEKSAPREPPPLPTERADTAWNGQAGVKLPSPSAYSQRKYKVPESSTPICQHTSQAFSLPSSCPHPHHCPGPAGTAASQATVLTHILPCMGMGSAQVMGTAGSCAGRTMLCGTCGEGTTPGCEVPGHGRHWQSHLENSMWGNTATARFQLPGMLQPSEVVDAF